MNKIIYILLLIPLTVFSQEGEKNKLKKEDVKLEDKQTLRKGNDLYKQKKYADAEAKYKKALQQNQSYETAYYNLANTFYEQKSLKRHCRVMISLLNRQMMKWQKHNHFIIWAMCS